MIAPMGHRLVLAAAFAVAFAGSAVAQQQGAGMAATLYDIYGNPVGIPGFPFATSMAPASTSNGAITPTNGGTQTAYVAKAGGGNFYGYSATMGATAGFLAILNAAAAPASGAAIAPLECIALPANGYVARRQDIPDRYSTGITAVVSSSCTTYTAVAPVVTTLLVQ